MVKCQEHICRNRKGSAGVLNQKKERVDLRQYVDFNRRKERNKESDVKQYATHSSRRPPRTIQS